MTFENEEQAQRWRFEAACAALTGLLADTEDQADERRQEKREVEERVLVGQRQDFSDPFRVVDHYETRRVKKMVYTETCAEATARLAVEHADALLRALR